MGEEERPKKEPKAKPDDPKVKRPGPEDVPEIEIPTEDFEITIPKAPEIEIPAAEEAEIDLDEGDDDTQSTGPRKLPFKQMKKKSFSDET